MPFRPVTARDGMKGQYEYSWRELLTVRSEDLFPIADLRTARRVGGIFWLWGAAVALLLLPLAPPDDSALGDAGWPIAAAIILAAVAYGIRLLRAARADRTRRSSRGRSLPSTTWRSS